MEARIEVFDISQIKSWQIPHQWIVAGSVLSSMILQVILVSGGALRHRLANMTFTSFVWLAYVSSDCVAESALGSMFHSSASASATLFAVWSPLLLLHLGGPDTITAYSLPDNQLWLRHLVNMLYQTTVAVYVLCLSAIRERRPEEGETEWYLLAAGLLVFVAGFSKYTERTCALCFADRPKIIRSTRNIYVYMQSEDKLPLPNGDQRYQYIVVGEEHVPTNPPNGELSSVPEKVVTVQGVWEHEGRERTNNYILCVSHALFKMYKRRLVSLRLHEAYHEKTRRFFVEHFEPEQLFRIVELELKFLYDYLFSKSSGTAFSRCGVAMRLVNTSLLGLALFLVCRGLREKDAEGQVERMATYILLCVATVVEIVQLCRLLLSDWSMVWLICADIRRNGRMCSFTDKLIPTVIRLMSYARNFKLRDKYWKNQIQQHCFTNSCLRSEGYPLSWKVFRMLLPRQKWYLKVIVSKAFKAEPLKKELQEFIFEKIKVVSGSENPMETITKAFQDYMEEIQKISNEEILKEENESPEEASKEEEKKDRLKERKRSLMFRRRQTGKGAPPTMALEDLILAWHVATTILEKLRPSSVAVNNNIRCSRIISSYCTYLMVSCPRILPLHPDNAKTVYRDVFSKLDNKNKEFRDIISKIRDQNNSNSDMLQQLYNMLDDSHTLKLAKGIVQKYHSDSERQAKGEEMWEELADQWAKLLMYLALYDKSAVHEEQLTYGGEFITQIWVIMGHIGLAEPTYALSGMKIG